MTAELALDLGTGSTRIADPTGVLLVEEPTVAAVDRDSGRVVAFGVDALSLGARAGGRVRVQRPVQRGQLVDIDVVEGVLAEALRRAGAGRLSRPHVLVCTHVGATPVQHRALDRAVRRAGAKDVLVLDAPTACAIGAGIDIDEPAGTMVVDVGAGTVDVGVLALGGVVAAEAYERGGDDFDEAVREHLARERGILVDRETARDARLAVGTLDVGGADAAVEVEGREVRSGWPATVPVSASELRPILDDLAGPMLETAQRAVANAPAEVLNDLLSSGLLLAGGGGLLDGFDRALARATGVPVHVASEAGRAAVLGAARCLERADGLSYAVSVARAR